jgi:hypothetical protein
MPGLLRLQLVTPPREKSTRRSRLPGQANRLDDPGRNAGRHGLVGHRSVNNSSRQDARAIADVDVEDHASGPMASTGSGILSSTTNAGNCFKLVIGDWL